ncbi:L-lactate dehydrogenase complex protein LldG [Mycolicibacterium sp. BK634]|uniref:LutC/YkgG family protein n=1 Tax=Mycobacteriaceae TaxID=1762 RepID=UPI00106037FB|nr:MULTISPECIES: LUD domain-containing protein [Mycobacteriaceae]MBB3748731.1 L-lactate dehydrogenase complex protein LldG [Mycolicibacterium sp. BK634]TDO15078.1 L-lactate dehydrogenase complex protein LldG [Mycobacterium sp. BK086]
MTETRRIVLDRIRGALAAAPPEPVQIPRDYERQPARGPGDPQRFAETVAEYRAQVLRLDDVGAIAPTIASLVGPDGRVAVPTDLPPEWVMGIRTVADDPENPLPVTELDQADAVVTGCALGIAVTGTIVLDAGPAQGRRALTLIPDHHICVVFTDQIVDTVPQAFAALDPRRPLTFISGPSATSDIELNRVEGVHGPRTLDVLLVSAATLQIPLDSGDHTA